MLLNLRAQEKSPRGFKPVVPVSISNYRYYSPELGRWMTRDPIRELGGVNLYGMVGNNPVKWWDYLGLSAGCSKSRSNTTMIIITWDDGTTETLTVNSIDDLEKQLDKKAKDRKVKDLKRTGEHGKTIGNDDTAKLGKNIYIEKLGKALKKHMGKESTCYLDGCQTAGDINSFNWTNAPRSRARALSETEAGALSKHLPDTVVTGNVGNVIGSTLGGPTVSTEPKKLRVPPQKFKDGKLIE